MDWEKKEKAKGWLNINLCDKLDLFEQLQIIQTSMNFQLHNIARDYNASKDEETNSKTHWWYLALTGDQWSGEICLGLAPGQTALGPGRRLSPGDNTDNRWETETEY